MVATVDGDSAASMALDKAGRVTIGGELSAVGAGGSALRAPRGLLAGGVLDLTKTTLWGGGDCELAKPLKVPNDPDSLLEKLFRLLLVAEDLLELVDCDHRFRFPTPSLIPVTLSG